MAKKLGKLTVEIDADSDRLESSTTKAKSELKDVGDAGKKSGKQVGAGFQNVGTKIQKSTEGVRTFTSSLTETVGVVTGIVGVFGTLTAVLVNVVNKSKEFRKNLKETIEDSRTSLKNTLFDTANLRDVDKEIQKIQKEATAAINKAESEFNTGFAASAERFLASFPEKFKFLPETADLADFLGLQTASEQLGEIEKSVKEIRRLSGEEENAVAMSIREQAEEQFARRAEQIRIGLIDDEIEKIKERTRVEFEEERKVAENAGALDTKRFRELVEQIEARQDAEIEAARDAAEAKEKIEDQKRRDRLRKDQEAAKAAAEAFRQELSGVADSLFGGAGGDFTTKLDTLINEVRSVNSAIGRRP